MINKLFYSWQSDINQNENRYFIRDCVKKAIKDFDYFYFDEATRDSPGSPDIAETIFSKIDLSSGFIADITFINSEINNFRKCPNPNVTLELGYAASVLSWENIILIFNTAYGELEDLPFDFRNRRIITYKYPNPNKSKKEVQLNLIDIIKGSVESFDLKKIENNHKIKRHFFSESPKINRIINMQSKNWHILLIIELLRKIYDDLEYEQYLVTNEMIFLEAEKTPLNDTVKWSGQLIRNYANLLKSLKKLMLQETEIMLSKKDPIRILKWTEQIKFLYTKLIDFERKLLNFEIDPIAEVIRKPFIGITNRAFVILLKFTAVFKVHDDPDLRLNQSDFEELVNLKMLEGKIKEIGKIIIEKNKR